MKFFLKKFSFITIYFFLLKVTIFVIFNFSEKYVYKDYFKNGKYISMVGNSHLNTGVNDKILSDKLSMRFKNYGAGGQAMFWSLIGAKKLINQGSDYVFIEVNNGTYTTGWKATDRSRGLREYRKIYHLNMRNFIELFFNDPIFSIELFLFKTPLPSYIVRGAYIPKYKKFNDAILAENKINIGKVDYNNRNIDKFIKNNYDTKFFIFRAPQHPEYYKQISESNEKHFKKCLDDLRQNNNCTVMDFGKIYNEDSMFIDLEHMSSLGADKFSNLLVLTLKEINFFNN